MEKNDFINELKKYLPANYKINIAKSGRNLIIIRKNIFSTYINLHSVFLKGDKNIIQSIINFIKKNSFYEESKRNLNDFYERNQVKRKVKIKKTLHHKDIHSFLIDIINEIKDEYKEIDFTPLKITWGKYYKNRRRSIRFGSFDRRHDLIRMHPVLDNEKVPDFFIKSVIYHETAHFIMFCKNHKDRPHSREFREIVKNIDKDLKTSRIWEKNNKLIFFDR